MGIAWDENGQLFAAMGITETQFITAVKNRKEQIIPYVENQEASIVDKTKGVAIVNDMLNWGGANNAGGCSVLAVKHDVPESHALEIERAFSKTVIALNADGDLD